MSDKPREWRVVQPNELLPEVLEWHTGKFVEASAYDALKSEVENQRQRADYFSEQTTSLGDEVERLLAMLEKMAGALESSNKTIMYLMEEYANGNGVRLGHATVSFNKQVSAEYRREFGEKK